MEPPYALNAITDLTKEVLSYPAKYETPVCIDGNHWSYKGGIILIRPIWKPVCLECNHLSYQGGIILPRQNMEPPYALNAITDLTKEVLS